MRFWDTSGLVPLVCEELETERCVNLLKKDRSMIVWCFASVEIHSVLCRKYRERKLTKEAFRAAKERAFVLFSNPFASPESIGAQAYLPPPDFAQERCSR